MKGLYEKPRPGAQRKATDGQVEQTVVRTPSGQTYWSTRTSSEATGLDRMTISQIWRTRGSQSRRIHTFKLLPGRLLIEKVCNLVYCDIDQARLSLKTTA